MRRRQLEPSQSFTAGMPVKLNSSHLRRHAGGKDWDDQCCRPLLFSYRNSIPSSIGAHGISDPPLPHHSLVGIQGKPSLRASSSIMTNEASCERTRPSHSRLLSRAAVAWLLATLPNAERKPVSINTLSIDYQPWELNKRSPSLGALLSISAHPFSRNF